MLNALVFMVLGVPDDKPAHSVGILLIIIICFIMTFEERQERQHMMLNYYIFT